MWWVGGELLTFLPRVVDGGEWWASCPVQYIRWGKAAGTHWIGAKGRSGRCGEEENMSLMSIIDPRFLCRPFLSLITIPTELSRFTRNLSCWFISTFSTTSLISKRFRPYMRRIREVLRNFKLFFVPWLPFMNESRSFWWRVIYKDGQNINWIILYLLNGFYRFINSISHRIVLI